MNDMFFEESVARQSAKGQGALTKASIVVAAFTGVISLTSLVFGQYKACLMMLIPCVLFIILTIYYMNNTNLEFEYVFVDGTIEISKIINKSKRKPIVKFEVQEIIACGDHNADGIKAFAQKDLKKIDCSAQDGNEHVVVFHSQKNNQDTAVFVNFSERMMKAISRHNPRSICK